MLRSQPRADELLTMPLLRNSELPYVSRPRVFPLSYTTLCIQRRWVLNPSLIGAKREPTGAKAVCHLSVTFGLGADELQGCSTPRLVGRNGLPGQEGSHRRSIEVWVL
jgi:hypothetical protein